MFENKIKNSDVYEVTIWGETKEVFTGSWYEVKAKMLTYGNKEDFQLSTTDSSDMYLSEKDIEFHLRKKHGGHGRMVALYDTDLHHAWEYDEYYDDYAY